MLVVLPVTLFIIAGRSDWQMGASSGHRGFTDLMLTSSRALASFLEWTRHKP